MAELIEIYDSWSWLIQSLIGASVFTILQISGSRFWELVTELWSKSSKQRRIVRLKIELARLNTVSGDIENRTLAISVLTFRALRRVVKGLVWISLGLLFGAIAPTLGVIGFLGGLFYFFSALEVVARIESDNSASDMMAEIDKELIELQNEKTPNNQIN